MAWYSVDPRYLRQSEPENLVLAYVSHGERDTGHLVLYVDADHAVTRFELSYDRFLGRCELYAEWDQTAGLRVGEVDTHGRTGSVGPRYPMSPIVHHRRRATAADLGSLLGYVTRNADILDPRHGQVVMAALRNALRDTAGHDE